MKYLHTITVIAAGLIAPAIADQEKANKPDAAQFVGIYEIVSGQEGEREMPKEQLEGKVGWTEKTISGYDRDDKKLYAATYKLDTSEEPWKITMNGTMMPTEGEKDPKAFESKGLVKIEGDLVTLIYDTKGGQPDDFEVGENEHKFVFRKTASAGE